MVFRYQRKEDLNGVVIGDKLPGFNLGAETPLLTKSGGQNLAVVGGQFSVVITNSYVYDHNGNRTQQVETQNDVDETTDYTYDELDRLVSFTVTGAKTTVTAYTYEGYNRKTETVTEDGAVTKQRSHIYDQTDWLTRIDDTTNPASPYTTSYTYDNNGNTLTKSDSSLTNQDETFAYDALNRLVETRRGPPATQTVLGRYDYNAEGLRVRHRLSERGDVDYYYDDNAVIEEHNAGDNSLLAHYRYADRLISLDTGSTKQYYHHDALGSTVNLTTATAALQVAYKLDPWGHILDQQGTSVNRQIFTGQEHDANTGLIYFGARYYDPDTARFITQDSYLGESGTPPSLHRYQYAYSNPTVYIDLYGNAVFLGGSKSEGFVAALPYNASHFYFDTDFVKAFAEANSISAYDAMDFIRQQYAEWGVNKENAFWFAAIVLEKNDGSTEGMAKALEMLGGSFNRIYEQDESLQKALIQRFEGAKPGDLINIGEFWGLAVGKMISDAAYSEGKGNFLLQKLVEGEKLGKFQSWIAGNELANTIGGPDFTGAPPSEKEHFRSISIMNAVSALTAIASFTDLPVIGMVNSRGAGSLEGLADELALKNKSVDFYVNEFGTAVKLKHWETYKKFDDLIANGLVPDKESLSVIEARIWYLMNEERIPLALNAGYSKRAQAFQAFSMRNILRTKTRDLMNDKKLAEDLMRREKNYKWREIIQKYKEEGYSDDALWKIIIEKSTKSRGPYNAEILK